MELKEFVPWLIGAIAVAISLSSFLYTRKRNKDADRTKADEKQDERFNRLKDEFEEVCRDVAILKKQMAVFWSVIETNAGKMLHAPTHHRRDELIERLVGERPPPLTIEEVDELSCEMQAIIDAPNERIPGERMYAILMRGRLEAKKAKHELLETTKARTINQC